MEQKQKVSQLIVVEGKNDTAALKRALDCDTIETGGLGLTEATLAYIKEAAKTRGIIIFTDPDNPGEAIRRKIQAEIPEAAHAFIDKRIARTDRKVGVEHADPADIRLALANLVTFVVDRESLAWADFVELGLVGNKARRESVCMALHIGPCNGKTCFKRLNQMGKTRVELERILHDSE